VVSEKHKGKLILITSHVLSDLEELTTDIMYLHEGKVIFNKTLQDLQTLTGEQKLGKAVSVIIKRQQKNELSYLKIAK
jgi:Cu-processing system ATP-binding protein